MTLKINIRIHIINISNYVDNTFKIFTYTYTFLKLIFLYIKSKMINPNLLLDTLRINKIKSNQMYWNFINDLKPYFWSSLMYRLISYNNKHHNNCLSTLLKLIQSKHNKNKITQKSKVVQESKPTKVIQESKPTKVIQESKPTNEAIVNKISTDKPKPKFKGKMPHSSTNNFKEYLKNKLNIDSSKSIPRQKFNTLCEEYKFDKDKYNSSQPWFEYIKHNMII